MPPSESKSYEQDLEMEPIFAQALNSIPSNNGNPTKEGAPVVWLNGYPGTGKLTVATALIDQVKISRRNPRYWDARKTERRLVFEKYVLSNSHKDRIVIFTDFQTETNNGAGTSIEYLQAARQARRPFLPVSLTCQEDENIRRATNPARCVTESGRVLNKLTDGSSLRRLRRLDLFDFDDLVHYEDTKMDGLIIDS
ncbi:Putative P-loop containing nucleoside triphosphate hydrolase [Colletotrichum destructivum]|uniref:P-loop containing nucleoside triphosphate hydrolase n=1 Tax=Colletotrichum destructivum TaxID=34406 RepID=A0AAX4ICE6_9PEZI|nr:Putative P-loop containing nucleoside triphosphate hydrolase [Colletotrichum destructivum]